MFSFKIMFFTNLVYSTGHLVMWLFKKDVVSLCFLNYRKLCSEVFLTDTISNKKELSDSRKFLNHYKNCDKKTEESGLWVLNIFKCNVLGSLYNYDVKINVVTYLSAYNHLISLNPQLWKNLISAFTVFGDFEGVFTSTNCNILDKDEQMFQLAKDAWLKGNIDSSFDQFIGFYEKGDSILQRKLIKILQQLIFNSIETNGMAVVRNVIYHVKKFSVEKKEWFLLMTLWYALFISRLYEDNSLSASLLVDSSFKNYLEPFTPYFGAIFLKNNEVGLYQCLIETALCHKMDNAAATLLRLLFDYYYKTGYFVGCSAVYKCCINLEIKLTRDQIYKYSVLRKTNVEMKSKLLELHNPKEFIYKF